MTIPLTLRFDILKRDSYTCRYCGKRAVEAELEVDHVHPRSKGGSDEPANLVTTCRDCNRGKGDREVPLPLPPIWASLVGKFFHTFEVQDGVRVIACQGRIVAELGHGYYVTDFYQWFSGTRAFFGTRVHHLSHIARERWALYEDDEAMRDAYDYGGAKAR